MLQRFVPTLVTKSGLHRPGGCAPTPRVGGLRVFVPRSLKSPTGHRPDRGTGPARPLAWGLVGAPRARGGTPRVHRLSVSTPGSVAAMARPPEAPAPRSEPYARESGC